MFASSPESWQNSAPEAAWVISGRTLSAEESFTPTMLGSLARRAMVSGVMSTTERPGML